MAGFKHAEATYGNALWGKGSGKILLSDVECTGKEKSLFDCKHSGFYAHDCSHDEDVGVVCGPAPEGILVIFPISPQIVGLLLSLLIGDSKKDFGKGTFKCSDWKFI